MTTRSHMPSFNVLLLLLLLAAAVGSVFATGCVEGELFANRIQVGDTSYDAQTCVENALRHNPDPEGVREATVVFARACAAGEAAACSAAGVMHELGLGFPADPHRARELYAVACEAHNARACENLTALMTAGAADSHEQVATLQR